MTTRRYKDLKGLKKENLRDNMSTLELALNMLAEATTTELTRTQNPHGLTQNRAVPRPMPNLTQIFHVLHANAAEYAIMIMVYFAI